MEKRSVAVVTGSRAEKGLLEPVLKRLKSRTDVDLHTLELWEVSEPYELAKVIDLASTFIKIQKPEVLLVPCDRLEALGVAIAAFFSNVIVFHFHAGEAGVKHPDEVSRQMIQLTSHVYLCAQEESKAFLLKQGVAPSRVFLVGSTAFDDVKPNCDWLPKTPFDALVLHPDSYSEEATRKDTRDALARLDKLTFMIGPNRDRYREAIMDEFWAWKEKHKTPVVLYYDRVPRDKFLGLLQRCVRAIGNSSSFIYELPYFGKRHVQIGLRNADRVVPAKIEAGGSDRITELLAKLPLDHLRRK